MRILHLANLHATESDASLEELWAGPRALLATLSPRGAFDAVVVSGDLAQRAEPWEYDELLDFTERALLPLVAGGDRSRVVFAPGNHDAHRAEAAGSPARFKNVQHFLDRFYTGALPAGHRRFALTGADPSARWSAHLFPAHDVAVYAFSTVDRCDRDSNAASLSRAAVRRAAEHAAEHAAGMTRVAVWHHGLQVDPARHDGLTAVDLAELEDAGFRVGLHGHASAAAAAVTARLFGDRFVVVAAGSLGAPSKDRPDALGRHLNVVDVLPGQVRAQGYAQRHVGVFAADGPARRALLADEPARPVSRASLLRRQVAVDALGVATVTVVIDGLDAAGDVGLLDLAPPFGSARHDANAHTARGRWDVARADLPGGAARFTLRPREGRADALRWQARVAGALALHRAELAMMPRENAPEGVDREAEESHAVEVELAADRLELEVSFPAGAKVFTEGAARAVVERRRDEGGVVAWERAEGEESPSRARVTSEGERARLVVEAPRVGHRYALAWAVPDDPTLQQRPEAADLARLVVAQCRREFDGADGVSARLARALEESLEEALGVAPSTEVARIGFLWHPDERRLLAAYGRMRRAGWGARFALGHGVAGHALRFAAPAAWHQRAQGASSLFYRPSGETRTIERNEHPYEWLLAVPIWTGAGTVGVVSLAGAESSSEGAYLLGELARRRASSPESREPAGRLEQILEQGVSLAFWRTLAALDEARTLRLPKPLRETVDQVLAELQRAGG
ncbi:MAG: metallophosphoesterase [Polyangiales bacterium]